MRTRASRLTATQATEQFRNGRISRREFLQFAAALGVTAVTPSFLAACTPKPNQPSAENPIELVYQDWRTDWFPPMAQEMLAQFHTANPHIKVFYSADPENLEQAMQAAMQAGTAPDVFQGCCAFFPAWAQQGYLLDLRPYIEADFDDETINDWSQAQYNAFSLPNGMQFALPKYHGALALFYNKDIFDERGVDYPDGSWDHDDYLEAMKQLTFIKGSEQIWGSMLDPSWDRLQMHINGWGGHFVDPNDPTRCLMGEPEALAAFQWIHDRIWQDHVMASFIDVENQETRAAFYQGRVAMVEEGSWALKDILVNANFRIGLAPFPSGPVKRVTLATTDGFAINANTPYPDEAWELLKFFISKEYGRAMAKTNFLQPARASLVDEWADFIREEFPEETKDLDIAIFADGHINDYSVTVESFPNMTQATQLASAAFNQIYTLNQLPVDYIKELCTQIEAVQPQAITKAMPKGSVSWA